MSKIEKLTAAQTAKLAEYRDEWIAIGLSTAPADREKSEAAIVAAYAIAKLPPPKIVWCGSPLSQGLTRAIILDQSVAASVRASVRDSVGASVRDLIGASVSNPVMDSITASVGASVRDSVRASVNESICDMVWDPVWASVWASVRASVRASVWVSVWNSVGDSVWRSVGDSLGYELMDSIGDSVWDACWDIGTDSLSESISDSVSQSGYGQHDAGWLALCAYFRDVVGLTEQVAPLAGLIEQARHSGWYLAHEKICWISERHNLLCRDERGRLHNLSGPAVAYPDGWAIYAVHGVRVPATIIEHPERITADKILAQQNTEVQRVMLEVMGHDRFLSDAEAKPISTDSAGELFRIDLPYDEELVLVRVVNATAEPNGEFKRYILRVPPEMQTAREAVAWTFGLTSDEYCPRVES